MNRKQELLFKGALMKWIREFFEKKNIPEVRYNQFSFAGSCENAPTTYWIDKDDEFLMLPQTRQIMAERDLILHDMDAVFMMQTSYRDEPRAGDGRHCNQFLLCEMEHKDMSQKELIDFEEEMLRFCINKALYYFDEHPELNISKGNIARLKYTLDVDMPRISYSEAIKILNERGVSINWGDDFTSSIEEVLCGLAYDLPVPVAVYDYPESLKYFNMFEKRGKTDGTKQSVVECCDVLLPFAGETWGSSKRENDGKRIRDRFYKGTMYKQLYERLRSKTDNPDVVITEAFEPYFKLFDTKIHNRAGFGMGVGRFAQFLLGRTEIVEM